MSKFSHKHSKPFNFLENNPHLIEYLLEKYKKHPTQKRMNILKSIKEILLKDSDIISKDLSLTLADGNSIIKVITKGEQIQVGHPIQDENNTPLSDGDYLLADGREIRVKDGVISHTKEASTEQDTAQTLEQETKVLKSEFQAFKKERSTYTRELENTLKIISESFQKLQKDHLHLAKSLKSMQSFPPPFTQPNPLRRMENRDDDISTYKAFMKNRQNKQ